MCLTLRTHSKIVIQFNSNKNECVKRNCTRWSWKTHSSDAVSARQTRAPSSSLSGQREANTTSSDTHIFFLICCWRVLWHRSLRSLHHIWCNLLSLIDLVFLSHNLYETMAVNERPSGKKGRGRHKKKMDWKSITMKSNKSTEIVLYNVYKLLFYELAELYSTYIRRSTSTRHVILPVHSRVLCCAGIWSLSMHWSVWSSCH